MQYYFAPMEGITDSIYRQLHHKFFPGIHRYYTPFFSPTIHRSLTQKERRELQPASALDFAVVPQILTKNPEDFIWMAQQCQEAGYSEVNLNLGCPSGTVTAKGKGAGALRDLDSLDLFLDAVFRASPLPVSVKTRIGFSSSEEFPKLLDIFNRYPVRELIIHPRTRAAFYTGQVDMDCFRYAVAHSRNPLCYNGNLCSREDIRTFSTEFPGIHAVMLGRGLVADPGMLTASGTDIAALEQFHNGLLDTYTQVFGSSRNAIFRMKENWHYWICRFRCDAPTYKRLQKTTDIYEYREITQKIFSTLPFSNALIPNW